MNDNVKVIIQAVTSALGRGEHSNIAEAYMDEIDAMLGKGREKEPSRKDNTVGQRVKDVTTANKEAKASGEGLAEATNTLPDAIDQLLVDAASRATWSQRQTRSRLAGWSPSMAKHTAALKSLKESKQWPAPWLEKSLAELPKEQTDNLPSPWARDDARRDSRGRQRRCGSPG